MFQRLYEDEELEKEIYDIVCNNKDCIDIIRQNNQYKYHYSLSPLRHDLFQWYPFEKEGSLLEIGAGYGQLTPLFTQKVNRVVAVEDSTSKCNIISKRAEDASVVLSDFDDIQLDEKFDYIILCNIFEYAKSFVESENPYVDYLNYLKKFLKDDGVILIALSNRLGLKYFSGYKEEHSNHYFYGINGFDDSSIAQTFSKTELSDLVKEAGFTNYKFFYPYPSHEFTQVVHTDKLVNKIPFMGAVEFSDDRLSLFDEGAMNQTLSNDGLSQYFANSFLVEIRSGDFHYPTDDIDFVKLHSDRKDEFKIYTTIWSDGTVSKSPISSKADEHIKKMFDEKDYVMGRIKCLDAEMKGDSIYYDFVKQKSCENLLIESVLDNDKKRFFKGIEDYYDALFYDSFETDEYATEEFLNVFKVKSDIPFHCHEKSNIDMNFANMFLIDGEFTVIDYEWIFDFPVPLEYQFFISFNYHFYSNELIREFTNFEEIFNHFNMDLENIELFREWNCNFLRYVLERPPLSRLQNLSLETLIESYNSKQEIGRINKKVKSLQKKNKKLKSENSSLKKLNDSMLNSRSWKLTKPLRKIMQVKKGVNKFTHSLKVRYKPEISIIIPVYNVEKYLDECINSAVNQTFDDIEIICVNDGSTDGSLEIIEKHASKDKRIRIISQEHKGVGSARNAGLDAAKGKYVYFMDSDDYVELNALKELHNLIEEKSCDLIIFKTYNFIDETREYINIDYHDMPELTSIVGNEVFNYQDHLKQLIPADVTVYTKFFKREIISDIRFIEDLIFEDNIFTMNLIFNSESIYLYDRYLYHRRIRKNSIISSNSKSFMDCLSIFKIIEDMFKEKGHYEDCKEILFSKKIGVVYSRLKLIDDKYKEEFFKRIKLDLKEKQEEYENLDFNMIDNGIINLYKRFCNCDDYSSFISN